MSGYTSQSLFLRAYLLVALLVVIFSLTVAAWMFRYTPLPGGVWDRWTSEICGIRGDGSFECLRPKPVQTNTSPAASGPAPMTDEQLQRALDAAKQGMTPGAK